MLTVKAPAKINMTLEVLGKRDDGYHEIRSVMQSVDLYDIVTFRPSDEVACTCDMEGWNAEKSLVSKSVTLLKQETGYSGGVSIEMKKQIPLLSGLGGDSSDTAAVLRGLNELWKLNLTVVQLEKLAGQLGSDVFFFLQGGTALVEGRGEAVTLLSPLPRCCFVIVIPPTPVIPGKTKKLYASLEPNHFTDSSITKRLVERIEQGKEIEPSLLFNTFENVAYDIFPGLDVARSHLLKMGAPFVHLSGSGPALYTILDDMRKAEELCSLVRKQNMQAFVARPEDGW